MWGESLLLPPWVWTLRALRYASLSESFQASRSLGVRTFCPHFKQWLFWNEVITLPTPALPTWPSFSSTQGMGTRFGLWAMHFSPSSYDCMFHCADVGHKGGGTHIGPGKRHVLHSSFFPRATQWRWQGYWRSGLSRASWQLRKLVFDTHVAGFPSPSTLEGRREELSAGPPSTNQEKTQRFRPRPLDAATFRCRFLIGPSGKTLARWLGDQAPTPGSTYFHLV